MAMGRSGLNHVVAVLVLIHYVTNTPTEIYYTILYYEIKQPTPQLKVGRAYSYLILVWLHEVFLRVHSCESEDKATSLSHLRCKQGSVKIAYFLYAELFLARCLKKSKMMAGAWLIRSAKTVHLSATLL